MGGGVNSISVLCGYFLVDICILAGPFLNMIYYRKLEKFADTMRYIDTRTSKTDRNQTHKKEQIKN